MEMLCRKSGSSMRPMRISLPFRWMGGLASIRLIFSPAFPLNHSPARMRPVTCTCPGEPVRTSTLPEPVLSSMCTGPVTCKERWNEPSAAAAAGKAGRQIITARATRATNQLGMEPAESTEETTFRRFMVSPGKLSQDTKFANRVCFEPGIITTRWRPGVPARRDGRDARPPSSSRILPLLQHHLVAFLQTAEQLGLGAVGDADIDRDFLLAVFGASVGNFNRRLLVFVVNNRAFGNLKNVLVFFQNDFRVGGHLSLQLPARVVDGDAYLKGSDVIFLHTHR